MDEDRADDFPVHFFEEIDVSEVSDTYLFDEDPGIWEFYDVVHETVEERSRVSLPPMSASGATVVVQTAAPTKTMRVTWACSRAGGPPKDLPKGVDSSTVKVMKERRTKLQLEHTENLQSMIYRIGGEIVYQVLDPATFPEYWPLPPWITLQNVAFVDATFTDAIR
jgi:hypothetical protein